MFETAIALNYSGESLKLDSATMIGLFNRYSYTYMIQIVVAVKNSKSYVMYIG